MVGTARTATAIGILSLSYVAGGVAATLLARQIVASGGGWRAVMGFPSLVLALVAFACARFVRAGGERAALEPSADLGHPTWPTVRALLRRPQFLIACALSFTVTLMRESFNTWSVDFLTSIQTGTRSVATAALHSIGFDGAGACAILATGLAYDRISPSNRRWLMAATLALLAGVIGILPRTTGSPLAGAALVGAVGLLVYGPYSLLSGVLAVESGGARLAATAAGIIDGVGYLAAILAGAALGRVLDVGGYTLGFTILSAVTAVSAVLALALKSPTLRDD